jgi:GT2 family glycosyltransferase
MKISIDVIIPSFRLDEKYILPILQLKKPDAVIKFYLLVDNPSLQPSPAIASLADNENIFLLINNENIGAAETRNKGIAAGKGDWILFLDDDIFVNKDLLDVYANAIRQYPREIGFIGLINFPESISNFTKAIKASGSTDIFSIAKRKTSFAWGATANTMINRNAVGDVKFSALYPKSGGGEDVDFFLKVRQRNNYRNFKTLPQAIVYHPWWNNGTPDLKRPFRYGKGNSNLGKMNPQYTYYDFLNTPETLLISFIVVCVVLFVKPAWLIPTLIFMGGVLIIEILASTIQTIKRSRKANLKVIAFALCLRLAHESGLLLGKISKLQLWRIGERFHDDGKINKLYFYRINTYKIVKWILYPLLILFILYKYI